MVRRTEPVPGQEALLLVHPETATVEPRNFEMVTSHDEALLGRNINELNALSLFGAANQRDFMLRHPELFARYGQNADRVMASVAAQKDTFLDEAKSAYLASLDFTPGAQPLQQANDTAGLAAYKSRRWLTFASYYQDPGQSDRRAKRATRLYGEIYDIQANANRAHGARPHQSAKQRHNAQLPELTSQQRLVAIYEDPRAGMLPATNREKTLVMSWLDYFDNPDYPLEATDQLLEVLNRQRRPEVYSEEYGKYIGVRSAKSIIYELHDYLINARISLQTLQSLDKLVAGCLNPNVTLSDDDIREHPGMRPLIRFRDGRVLRTINVKPGSSGDPLLTRENRQLHADGEKNKSVEDRYTGRTTESAMIAYIYQQASSLRVGDAKILLRESIVDQERRLALHTRFMESLATTRTPRIQVSRWLARRLIHEPRIDPLEISQA